jgi:hypothetical protein
MRSGCREKGVYQNWIKMYLGIDYCICGIWSCAGACGTCPSSTSTMKMGIERVLREKFGDAMKEVVQVDKQEIGASIPVRRIFSSLFCD